MWDWFCLEKPIVIRKDLDGNVLTQKYNLPSLNSKLSKKFHAIEVPGLEAVHWTYASNCPSIVCNGIYVNDYGIDLVSRNPFFEPDNFHLQLVEPNISVFDPDGKLPINLERNRVGTYEPLIEHLIVDVCRNFIAYALIKGPLTSMLENNFESFYRLNYPGFDYNKYYYKQTVGYYFATQDGFGITDPWNISHFSGGRGLIFKIKVNFDFSNISSGSKLSLSNKYKIFMCEKSEGKLIQFDYWYRSLTLTVNASEPLLGFKKIKLKGIRVIMHLGMFERFKEKQPKFILKKINIETVKKSTDKNPYVVFTIGMCEHKEKVDSEISEILALNYNSFESITECYFDNITEHPQPGNLAKEWQKAIGGPIIPYDIEKRKKIIERLSSVEYQHHFEEWQPRKRTHVKNE